jgi:hypothetical protein
MMPPPGEARLKWLEANADRPEVQEWIREQIARGKLRVTPRVGGGIHIVPVSDSVHAPRKESKP